MSSPDRRFADLSAQKAPAPRSDGKHQRRPASGQKYLAVGGIRAVKNGIRPPASEPAAVPVLRDSKPPWLRIRVPGGGRYQNVRKAVHDNGLATVCEESHCPNMGECWNHGTATLMLMGAICTRACKFCAVDTGNPKGRLDPREPARAARAVGLMKLRYVVLTSVDRDDLEDGGAGHYAACVTAIRTTFPEVAVEVLTPDFRGDPKAVRVVINADPRVFAQNLETVKRLTGRVRDSRAGYDQTLSVLRMAKECNPGVLTKTSIILGLGEREEEIREAMRDLRAMDCDILTLGQYLRPTAYHLPVARWVAPNEFEAWRRYGLRQGFLEVAAGPLVRSSYRADQILDHNNLGLSTNDASVDRRLPLVQI